MNLDSVIFQLSVIFVGAAVLGTLFLYARQPIIIAYIAIGIVLGPSGVSLVRRTGYIEELSHFGVILLLFLIGLNLQPSKLLGLFRKTLLLTLGTSAVFAVTAGLYVGMLGFDPVSSLLCGMAMMFSSTVVGLKLIPTTSLHQRRTGEIMTSVLLLQDMLAILVILFITGKPGGHMAVTFIALVAKFVGLTVVAFLGVRFVMIRLLRKFDGVQEYTFLTTLGWCLLGAETAHLLGLSYEMGAFVAGISIASSPVALVIAEHLKPLREFFLILFFFAVGSQLDFHLAPRLLAAAVVLGMALVPFKAFVFQRAFRRSGEQPHLQKELSVRLAQASVFSLLVAYSGTSAGILAADAAMLIQIATIVTFVVSTYWVVLKYPTPISGSPRMRQH